MLKKLFIGVGVIVMMSACHSFGEKEKHLGMTNPASEFCVKNGGKLEMKKDAQGNEYALCHLPDGTIQEEWDYFRKHNK